MSERLRDDSDQSALGGSFDRHFGGEPTPGQIVTISCGPHNEELPLAGATVGDIRRRFGGRFDIDPQSQAVLDGHEVDNQTIVRAGQALMFTRDAGEKGAP